MNNRDYKHFAPGCYYHLYNRGVGKQVTFFDAQDYGMLIYRLKENLHPEKMAPINGSLDGRHQGRSHTPYVRKRLPPNSFSLLCYVLMPNHFHFLVRQNTDLPISKLLAKVCTSYSKYFNLRNERVGPLFQDRFKAVLVTSDSQLLWLSAYIHQNPKVAGLVKNLEDWPYSSYPDYIAAREGELCEKELILGNFTSPAAYQRFVKDSYENIKARKDLENLLLD